jgi:hypothetical protein
MIKMVVKTYLDFELIEKKPKTNVYNVVNKESFRVLGEIKWHGPWRKYCFFPENNILFDSNCLKEVTTFIEKLMDERKKSKKEDYGCPDCGGSQAQFIFNWDEYEARDSSKEFDLVMECYKCKKHHHYKLPKNTYLKLQYPG